MSALAVVSLIASLLSGAMFLSWYFAPLPIVGVICGLLALKQIKAEPHYYAGKQLALAGIAISVLLAAGGVAAQMYWEAMEVPEGYVPIGYEQLRDPNIPLVGVQFPPASAKALDGEKVYIKGFIYPPPGVQPGQRLEQFVLCRDNGDCCFGGDPPILERILVTMKEGTFLSYSTSAQKLAGVLKVLDQQPTSDRTVGWVFYTLDVDFVR